MNFKIKKLIDSILVLSFSTFNMLFYFTPDPQQDKFSANYIAMVLFMRVKRIASLRKHVTTIANIVVLFKHVPVSQASKLELHAYIIV